MRAPALAKERNLSRNTVSDNIEKGADDKAQQPRPKDEEDSEVRHSLPLCLVHEFAQLLHYRRRLEDAAGSLDRASQARQCSWPRHRSAGVVGARVEVRRVLRVQLALEARCDCS